LDYFHELLDSHLGRFSAAVDAWCQLCPNLSASLPVVARCVGELVQQGDLGSATKVANFALEGRAGRRVAGLRSALEPLRQAVHNRQAWREEIGLLRRLKDIAAEQDSGLVLRDLANAYLAALESETSLGKRAELLRQVESDGVADDRLTAIGTEVASQLSRRKQLATRIGVAAAALLVLVIVAAVFIIMSRP
jgi:hypothetical protein